MGLDDFKHNQEEKQVIDANLTSNLQMLIS